jgi:hypothetical protein
MSEPKRDSRAEAYFLMLVATGLDCPHPPEFRKPPPLPSFDPSEWRCGVCFTVQISKPEVK